MTKSSLLPVPEDAPSAARPCFFFPVGRGSRGKTMLSRWAVETALNNGRTLTVADADRTNSTLSYFFRSVESPPSADPVAVMQWFTQLLETHLENRQSLLVDFGGGDLTLKQAAIDLDLKNFLEENDVQPVAIHLIGADPDDLAYLDALEDKKLFVPAATILVFNSFTIPMHIPIETAFKETVEKHKIVRRVLDRGGEIVVMPTLRCEHEINRRRVGFYAALLGETGNGLPSLRAINRQLLKNWLRDMEAAFSPVRHWLP